MHQIHDICFQTDCWNPEEEYLGNVNTTKSGKSCQPWIDKIPQKHDYDVKFPSLRYAGNKCRDPDSNAMPWCYTMDPETRWEFCDLVLCSGN